MTITNDDVVKALGEMSILEIVALTKDLEQRWGVEGKPQLVQSKQTETQVVVKDDFNVILAAVPADKKMGVIKALRDILGLGLKESKDLAESAPKMIKESVSKADADDMVTKLTAAGAVMELK
jgi:large subunit ribosomal protein L7/L12